MKIWKNPGRFLKDSCRVPGVISGNKKKNIDEYSRNFCIKFYRNTYLNHWKNLCKNRWGNPGVKEKSWRYFLGKFDWNPRKNLWRVKGISISSSWSSWIYEEGTSRIFKNTSKIRKHPLISKGVPKRFSRWIPRRFPEQVPGEILNGIETFFKKILDNQIKKESLEELPK